MQFFFPFQFREKEAHTSSKGFPTVALTEPWALISLSLSAGIFAMPQILLVEYT